MEVHREATGEERKRLVTAASAAVMLLPSVEGERVLAVLMAGGPCEIDHDSATGWITFTITDGTVLRIHERAVGGLNGPGDRRP